MARRPSQKQLFQELAAKFGPEVANAYLAAVRDLKQQVEFQKLLLALERRDLQAALEALHIDRAAFQPLEAKLTDAFVSGGQAAVSSMPVSVSIGFRFDPGNQRAAAILRSMAGKLITGLVETERQQARDFLADGMARGAGPRSVGLDLVGRISRATGNREGGLIGLSGPQRAYVASAGAELASTDPKLLKNYLTRKQRDRRYDKAVIRAIETGKPVPAETARSAVSRYSARLVRHRGEVIARTEGLPAIRAAKHEAFQQLVDDGRAVDADVERGWSTTRDGRERDTHGGMDGQVVRGLSTPFESPSGARFMYPGDTSLGAGTDEIVCCRCDEWIAVRRAA